MMFPGWQNCPVFDHEDRHEEGTDPGTYDGCSGLSPVQRMMLYSKVFERDNQLAENSFPLAETFCIQMNNPDNHALLQGLIDRCRQGRLIFVHKRYLQTYFREHHIKANPNVCYTIPDAEFTSGHSTTYAFSDEAVWEGSDGKAAFISDQTAPLEKGRSIHLPVWWYDYRNAPPLSPENNLPSVDLSGVTLEVGKAAAEHFWLFDLQGRLMACQSVCGAWMQERSQAPPGSKRIGPCESPPPGGWVKAPSCGSSVRLSGRAKP